MQSVLISLFYITFLPFLLLLIILCLFGIETQTNNENMYHKYESDDDYSMNNITNSDSDSDILGSIVVSKNL